MLQVWAFGFDLGFFVGLLAVLVIGRVFPR